MYCTNPYATVYQSGRLSTFLYFSTITYYTAYIHVLLTLDNNHRHSKTETEFPLDNSTTLATKTTKELKSQILVTILSTALVQMLTK